MKNNSALGKINWLNANGIEIENSFCTRHKSKLVAELWKRRPTRLFKALKNLDKLPEQSFFCFLDNEIARLPLCLSYCFYSNKQMQKLIELANRHNELSIIEQIKLKVEPDKIPAIPLVVETSNHDSDLPLVVFDYFVDTSRFSDGQKPLAEGQVLSGLINLFGKSFNFALPCKPALSLHNYGFADFSVSGKSHGLGLWVYLWLKQHSCKRIPRLCCTGNIESNSGQITGVENIALKIEAALAKNFEYVLIPRENLNEKFHADRRIIAFAHTEELNNWLLMNTGTGPGLRKVSAWLKADRQDPENIEFSQYFAHCEDNNINFLWHGKSLIKQQPQKIRVKKVKILLDKFFGLQKYSEANLHKVLPDFLWIALLPWQLVFWQDRNCLHAENLYLNFCQKFLTSQPEINLAANFINSNSAQTLIADKRFKTIRNRYPALLWLFFREPVEMLFLYSNFSELSPFEIQMLQHLCEELKNNAEAYCSVTSSLSADAKIMAQLVKHIDSQAHFTSGTRLVVRKRLTLLYSSWNNFYRQQKQEPVIKKAADVSLLLLKMHLKRLARKDKLDLTSIIEALNTKNFEPHKFEELRRHPVLNRFIKEFERNDCLILRKKLLVNPLAKEVVSNLNSKTRSLAWLPQPGAAFLSALEHDWVNFAWARVLNAFAERINLEPAQELMLFCLAHWAGRITATLEESSLNRQFCSTRKRFATAFSAGYSQACHENKDRAEAWKEDLNSNYNFEKWFLLLNLKADKEILARHEEFLLAKCAELPAKESLQKNVMARQFYRACLAHSRKTSMLTNEKKLFDGLTEKFLKNPASVRKTAQALVPVYFLLTRKFEKMENAISLVAHQLNNSQFVCEYIQTFVYAANVLRPINWHNSLDEQTYNSLVIGDLAIHQSPALDEFLFNFVDDPENIKRAFLLKEKFRNLVASSST